MKLLPFNSFDTGGGIRCPMCAHVHSYTDGRDATGTVTAVCLQDHDADELQFAEIVRRNTGLPLRRSHSDPPLEELDKPKEEAKPVIHLHRTCRRCGFTWMEQTAAAQKEDPTFESAQ